VEAGLSEGPGATEDRTEQTPDGDSRPGTDAGHPADDRVRQIRALDEDAFTELVAAVWSSLGYTTTVFSATKKAVYDIVALHQDPRERLLLWTVHRPDGGSVGSTVVKRCATARDSSQGADGATLVTSGNLTDAARTRAADLDVTVLDCEDLVPLLDSSDLGSLLGESE